MANKLNKLNKEYYNEGDALLLNGDIVTKLLIGPEFNLFDPSTWNSTTSLYINNGDSAFITPLYGKIDKNDSRFKNIRDNWETRKPKAVTNSNLKYINELLNLHNAAILYNKFSLLFQKP